MKTSNAVKSITSVFAVLAFLGMALHLQSCGDSKPAQTAADKNKELMKAATWKLQTVTADGVDQGAYFKSMTVKFGDGTYTTTNGGAVWPASGTWSFTDNTGTVFTREDGLTVSINNLTATTITLQLTWNKKTIGSGRVESIVGSYQFNFGV